MLSKNRLTLCLNCIKRALILVSGLFPCKLFFIVIALMTFVSGKLWREPVIFQVCIQMQQLEFWSMAACFGLSGYNLSSFRSDILDFKHACLLTKRYCKWCLSVRAGEDAVLKVLTFSFSSGPCISVICVQCENPLSRGWGRPWNWSWCTSA